MITHRGRFIVPYRGRRLFVKFTDSHVAEERRTAAVTATSERVALNVLRGLAVPATAPAPASLLRGIVSRRPVGLVVMEAVPGRPMNRVDFALPRLFGFWAAVTEQLVAFRRHEILYSDVKCANVLVARSPLRLTLIDFNRVCPVSPKGVYLASHIGFTPGMTAPEHRTERRLTERAVVFQLGMLWAQSISRELGVDNLSRPRGGLMSVARRTAAEGGAALARLLCDCLAYAPGERPWGYEDVLARLEKAKLPEASLKTWAALRAPYASRLAQVGLTGPARRA